MASGETKLSLLSSYVDALPDTALLYVVIDGVSYNITKAALLAGIAGGTTPPINTVLTAGHIVTTQDQIFQLSATEFLKINRAAQRFEFWDTAIDAVNPVSKWNKGEFTIKNAAGEEIVLNPEYTTFSSGINQFLISGGILTMTDGIGGQIEVLPIKITFVGGGNTVCYGLDSITVNGNTYLLPTSASSPLATQLYVDNKVAGLLDLRGSHDCSTNLFPTTGGSGTAGAIVKGDFWYVSVAGVLNGVAVNIGDSFFALNDSPTSGQWQILESNLGYVPEDAANKTDNMTGNTASSTKYLSAKGVYDYLISMTWLTNTIFGTFLQGQTAKDTLVDADGVVSFDSADSNKSKKTTWVNVWINYLKAKADALYGPKSDYIKLTAARTLASTTSLQSIFGLVYNAPANRTIRFRVEFDLVSLSSTSGSFSFGLLGTAGITNFNYKSNAVKTNSLDAVNADNFVSGQVTTAVVISNTGTQTNGKAFITGTIITSTAGTLDLAVATSVATGAAQVTNVSVAKFTDIGPNTLSQTSNIS